MIPLANLSSSWYSAIAAFRSQLLWDTSSLYETQYFGTKNTLFLGLWPSILPKLTRRDAKAIGTDWLIGFFLSNCNSCPNSPQQGKANYNNLESDQACEPKLCNHSLVDLRTDGSSTKMPFALMLLTLAKTSA